jgi:hypothetical protein
MRSPKTFAVLLLLSVLSFAATLFAQTSTGEANGTVTDQSGAIVSGATVTLTNQATKIENRTSTNDSGYFIFINVQPGTYVLRVEKQGFKTAQTAPFQISVNEAVTQGLTLGVGATAEVVQVNAETTLVDSTSTELGTVIAERAVNDLPLNGRNFTQLLTLTPGVTPVSTSQNKSIGCCEGNVGLPGSGFSDGSFHGQQNRSKLYFYDGIVNTNIRGPTYIVIPNIDMIQEFKVVGHDAKSEFGGATGGVVNLVSKSGTNNFHGSAFEYVRNNFFDARNSITDGPGRCTLARCPEPGQIVPSGPAPFHQNQFGAVLSGPIIKGKTFFSAGYDGWRYSQPDQALSYVPTAAEISGDFSNTSSSFRQQIFNPYSTRQVGTTFVRDAFRCDAAGNPLPVDALKRQSQTTGVVCNKIPQALIFAPMQQFFQKYAATPNIVDPSGQNNFVRNRPTLNNSDSFTGRVDHRFRDADNVFFRYTEQRNSIFTPIGEDGSTSGGSQGRNYGGGWTHLFSPNLILDLRAGYAGRPGVDAGQQNTHQAGLDPLKQMGFADIDKYHGLLVSLSNWTNGGNNNFGIRGSAPRENPNWSMTPGITWLKGKHNIKTGFWFIDAKRIQLNSFQTYTFANDQTRNPQNNSGGLSLASALLGFPNSISAQLPIPHGGPVKFKYASWATYLQDEWKLKPRLTLTLGLRYDYLTQPQTLDGRLWNAMDLDKQLYIIGAKTMPGLCSQLQQAPCIPDAFLTDPHASSVVVAGKQFFAPPPIKDNWGPRIGLAWAMSQKTVLRGGYGLYWDSLTARSQYAQNNLEAYVWPDATAFSGAVNACTNNNTCAFTNGTAVDIITQQGRGFTTPLPPYTGVSGLPWSGFPNNNENAPNYKDGYSQQWNFEVQRELSPSMMVSVGYVGSKSGRLPYTGNSNAAAQASPNNTCATTDAACNTAYTSRIDAMRLMPWVSAGISLSRSTGFAHYNALETKFQRRFSGGLQTLVSYTWSKSTDVSSGYFNGAENGPGGGSTVQNFFDPNSARGLSSYDIAHFFSWATVYELPAGRGKKWFQSGPLSWILGDWQSNYIFQARSGQPYNLQVTGDVANLQGSAPGGPGTYARPNMIADPFTVGPVAANPDQLCQLTISQTNAAGQKGKAADAVHTVASWFNPCAFGIPSGAFGNLGRNAFRGPHVVNMDFSMFKTIRLPREGMNLQLRFEGFNVFNIQNYDVPSALTIGAAKNTVIAAGAGQVTALAQGTTPRQLQFGLRFTF